MFLEPIIILILVGYLRKNLLTKKHFPHLDKVLVIFTIGAIALLIISTTVRETRTVVNWLNHATVFAFLYFLFTNNAFRAVRTVLYSIVPLVIISFIISVAKLISPSVYTEWKNVFSTATMFAFIWVLAIIIITKKQRKALEEERKKTQEIEREIAVNEKIKEALEVKVAQRTSALTLQKEELEKTLTELKSTQALLIQSEKMASLGELTAGIAHEIQNPLNFVNNFSEVSNELIDEMNTELAIGNHQLAIEIANDIKGNLEKINHHGKRADAIVKGMLQHSRSSSSIKEPTDINALCDEYLRLSYHGLRAKDKSFNATIKTDFDTSLEKVNIIPQDIGRVILNLLTNAFYVVDEKKKTGVEGYEPIVSISTKNVEGKTLISVEDNGNGIPQKVLDKIFQPFFTTKPTGQGTGLGLSMSYDIVTKAHGGELTVETKEGQGTVFIISLPNT